MKLSRHKYMRYRLRTLLIVVAVMAYLALATLLVVFARPIAEAASDYVMKVARGGRSEGLSGY